MDPNLSLGKTMCTWYVCPIIQEGLQKILNKKNFVISVGEHK